VATLYLVRHGRSAHVHRGLVDLAGIARWREAYEAAGIVEHEQPPVELTKLAAESGVIVASPAARAVQSARMLANDVAISPLLHELELAPPRIRGIRMPLIGWAIAIGLRSLMRPKSELQRVEAAADWLSELAEQHGSVLAVTHASFRTALSRQLIARGWRRDAPGGRSRHWSVWSFERARR